MSTALNNPQNGTTGGNGWNIGINTLFHIPSLQRDFSVTELIFTDSCIIHGLCLNSLQEEQLIPVVAKPIPVMYIQAKKLF